MLRQDLAYALRTFRRWPAFTAVAVLTLGLGIGANTAIFSVVDGVLLRPLPFPAADRLLLVWERNEDLRLPYMYASPPNLADWDQGATTFEAIGGYTTRDFTARLGGEPERMAGARITANLFSLVGVTPLVGRGFTADEDRPNGPRVLLLGYDLWQRRFGGRPGVVGKTVVVNDLPHEIVGVMPRDFRFPPPIVLESSLTEPPAGFWVPLAYDLADGQRGAHHITALGRLAPGATAEQAENEMRGIAARLARAYPDTNAGWDVTLVPLVEGVVRNVRPALLVLLGAVGFVLLQASVNVANLLMTRAVSRQREMAIRASLGAGRGRLVRQLLTENLLVALAGGAVGLLVAAWGVRTLVALAPPGLPRLDEVGLNPRVLLFTLVVSAAAGLLFGLVPALQVRPARLSEWLRDRDSSGERRQSRLFRHALVVVEVAVALVLLVGAGLLVRSFEALRRVDPGFAPARVLTLRAAMPQGSFGEPERRVAFVTDAIDRLRAVPAVESVGVTSEVPLVHDRQGTSLWREGEAPPTGPGDRVVNWTIVGPAYFATMGIPIIEGRDFSASDRTDSAPVILVDEAVARSWFSGENPIGQRVFFGANSGTAREIVGVVGRERHEGLASDPNPGVYLPYLQWPSSFEVSFVVRTATTAAGAAAAARAAIRAAGASVPINGVQTLDQVLADATAEPRFSALLVGVFALAALALAALGIYGVMSYTVSRRTREIGVRMALGARPAEIQRLVVGQAMALAAAGMALGAAGAVALGRTLASLLFQVTPADPTTFAVALVTLAAVALAACYLPARRATRVDPMVALRAE